MKKKVISNATCNCMEQMILDLKYAASNAVDWMQYKTKIGKKKFLANNKKNIHKTECDRERQIKKWQENCKSTGERTKWETGLRVLKTLYRRPYGSHW